MASLKGVFCIPIGTNKSTAGIKIKIPANTPDVVQFKISWGDGKSETFKVDYPKSSKDTFDVREHEYQLADCLYDKDFTITVIASFIASSLKADWRVPTFVYFSNPPTAAVLTNPNPACLGQLVKYSFVFCPNDKVISSISFGDNSALEKKATHDYTHTFTQTGTYNGKLYLENGCNLGNPTTVNFSTKIIDSAIPMMADSGTTRIHSKDTVLVCLNNGKAVIRLDGTGSENETQYYWSGTGFRYLGKSDANSAQPLIEFVGEGTFTISLEVNNACNRRSQKISKVYKIVALPQLSLQQPEDFCSPTTLFITNPIAGAIYTINDSLAILPPSGISLGYSKKTYILKASLSNICTGNTPVTLSRSFNIKPVEIVKILAPKDTSVCVASKPFQLKSNLSGGIWKVGNMTFDGTFDPKQTGEFYIKYSIGKGSCETSDSIKIRVIGTQFAIQNQTVCANSTKLLTLNPPIPNGIWSSDCSTCQFSGDTLFFVSAVTNLINVKYTAVGTNGCPGISSAIITLNKPKINRFEIKSGICEGNPLEIAVEVSGTKEYRWYIDNSLTVFSTELIPIIKLPAGNHLIKLEVGTTGCTDTQIMNVLVVQTPQTFKISSSQNPTNGCPPSIVSLKINQPERNDVTYSWTQNGKEFSSLYQPLPVNLSNTSTQNQVAKFILTIKNGCGLRSDTININTLAKAIAKLGVDSTTFRCSPANIIMTDLSTSVLGQKILLVDGVVVPFNGNRISLLLNSKNNKITKFLIQLIVTNACNQDTSSVSVEVYPGKIEPVFSMNDSTFCVRGNIILKDVTPSADVAGQVIWKTSDGQRFIGRNVQLSFPKAGKYWIREIVTIGCVTDSATRTVTIVAPPSIKAVLLTPTICNNQPVKLNYLGNNRIVWKAQGLPLDSTRLNPTFTFPSDGVKTIELTVYGSTVGCKSDTTFRVTVRPTPLIRSITAPPYICAGNPIKLVVEMQPEATELRWKFRSTNQSKMAMSRNPNVILNEGNYDVFVWFSDGFCSDSTQRLNLFRVDTCAIGIPEVFTPNGDQISDRFSVFGSLGIEKIISFKVFDNWANVIYFNENFLPNDLTHSWDGTNTNKIPMPDGNYAYEAEIKLAGSEQTVRKVGVVRLVR